MVYNSKNSLRKEIYPLLIDGKEVPSSSEKTFTSYCPATGRELASVYEGDEHDIDRAVAAAKRAFVGPWAKMTPKQRSRALLKFAEVLDNKKEMFAQIEMLDVGKPIQHSRASTSGMAGALEYYAGCLFTLGGESINVSDHTIIDFTLREPLGVCGLIVPWNYPVNLAILKLAPALAAGNTVVIKPSEVTPLSTTELGLAALEAGLPDGVINIVHGTGAVAGSALSRHPDVAKVSFTGGTLTGRRVYGDASTTLKRVTLELGGKSPLVVFANADMDAAVAGAYNDLVRNTGQVCAACTRVFLERPIHDEFVEKLMAKLKNTRIGLPEDENTEMGPLVNQVQRDKVADYAEIGQKEGATLQWAQDISSRDELKNGHFVAPALFLNANNDMRVAREEIFGPVQTVMSFEGEEQAVELANDSPYGLAAAIYTQDAAQAMRMARSVQAGTVCINTSAKASVDAPFGGYKESGIGKERGVAALLEDTQVKNVRFSLK